ncbi:ATP/GTP-binding site motif A (P-loop) :Porin, alpha proteobacteria type [Sinorhizobium sojae CCBAU 05684]|uniref:Porin n=1 Tax=Sinorhizobium sojae CCBAU 05684 TaxID=716928 RepID=A0A249P8R7_9HYPH|nr:porin [Sinorhizobium sojae]ASY62165.1 ATP/GTP-binding site motif A (P-loop) :Porin, alpha proteobacteria type [Sinorhizobium sojae CCBAU 05684]
MNIKSLLLGSAAALAAVSGAQAADAIVAAEPEPMEYVRVCDAFGTGYFYIPGTETCLKISGYVRVQGDFGRDESAPSDWDVFSRGFFTFDAKSDTEFGTLTGLVSIQADADNDVEDHGFDVDEAYIQLGGLKAGFFYSWWDKGLNGETDSLSSNSEFNSIAYLYDGGTFQAGIAIDELEAITTRNNGIGIEGIVSASLGGVSFDLLGGFDTELEEGAIRALLSADLGPGVFQLAGVWASDPNAYFAQSEWAVAASYAFSVTEKFKITPGAQYWSDLAFVDGVDQWRVGVTADYQITEGLSSRLSVQYTDADNADDSVGGFLRLQRDF